MSARLSIRCGVIVVGIKGLDESEVRSDEMVVITQADECPRLSIRLAHSPLYRSDN